QPAHRARRSAGRDPREPRPGRRGGRFPGLERYGIRGFFARCLRAVHRDGGNVGPTATPVPCLVPATDDYVSWNSGPPPLPLGPRGRHGLLVVGHRPDPGPVRGGWTAGGVPRRDRGSGEAEGRGAQGAARGARAGVVGGGLLPTGTRGSRSA